MSTTLHVLQAVGTAIGAGVILFTASCWLFVGLDNIDRRRLRRQHERQRRPR
jgi:hypothetical protein